MSFKDTLERYRQTIMHSQDLEAEYSFGKNKGTIYQSRRAYLIKKQADLKLKLEHQFNQETSQAIYQLRKEKVEHPFGHIKRNLGVTSFLLRGLEGVKAEMSLLASCFDITRLINIVGVPLLVAKLMS